jgi:hypothetical protein
MAKYKAVRSFFWKIEDGKRINIQKGKVYDLREDDYKDIGQYGLIQYKEDKKEESKK